LKVADWQEVLKMKWISVVAVMEGTETSSEGQPSSGKMELAQSKQSDISIIRDTLNAKRIQQWLDEKRLVPLVLCGHSLGERVAITAESLLHALKSDSACRALPFLQCPKSFPMRFCSYLVEPDIQAQRNYRPPGSSRVAPQLLVLPTWIKNDAATISRALRLGDVKHEIGEVLGYDGAAKRVKVERESRVSLQVQFASCLTWAV
jgi:hypothetical protein